MKIETTATEREIVIKFNGITHCRLDRREIVGLQSWITDRGRVMPTYSVQIYYRCGCDVLLEYDDIEKWKTVLRQLDETPFWNEWKAQDP